MAETRVLVVENTTARGYGNTTFQEKIDAAIQGLGKGWTVRSAQTTSCAHSGSCIADRVMSSPEAFFVTTIVMEKVG